MKRLLNCQKHLFDLDENHTYLNGAYMSPQLKSVQTVGMEHLALKSRPWEITINYFYTKRDHLKQSFAQLIDAPNADSIALIPSVSYGVASIASNVFLPKGSEVVVVGEQFPSNIYSWIRYAKEADATLRIIRPPTLLGRSRGKKWNQSILKAIGAKTAVVAMSHVHWADGTLYDLAVIREATDAVGALLVIDGTQSVGALPLSVQELQPDAVICAGYKWLMGPYSLGLMYVAEHLHDGQPIEHNWFNRYESSNFQNLTNYEDRYQSGAERYSVGESSNFINVPMLTRAINQIQDWDPKCIQEYCNDITHVAVDDLRSHGYYIEENKYRGKHLFGIYLPKGISMDKVKQKLQKEQINVSYRGEAIRVSPHVYNDINDVQRLASVLKSLA